jgi:translocation and assembly module TamA
MSRNPRARAAFAAMIRVSARLCLACLPLALLLSATVARADGIAYETKITGIEDKALQADLEANSQLVKLQGSKPPATVGALTRRARDDTDRLTSVVEAAGYYEPKIEPVIDEQAKPIQVEVKITPGPRYTLAKVALTNQAGTAPPEIGAFDPAAVGLIVGGPAVSAPVVDADARIARLYQIKGYPFARIVDKHVIVDAATKAMEVTFILDAGSKARFGAVRVNGLARLDESWVRRRIKWTPGAPFDQSEVEATRQAMVSSALFGTVSVAPDGPVGPDGTVPMQIYVIERAPRSVGVGGSYDTTQGISANVSWEHRNLFGGGEDLKFTATGGTSDNSLSTIFRLPDTWADNQDFVASLIFDDQNYKAYNSIEQKAQVGFERHFDPTLSGGASILAEHARVDEKVDFRTYVLVGTPVFLKKDGTDDLLNPTRGYRAGIEATPYTRALGSNLTFLQSKLTGSWYDQLSPSGNYILALQGTLGATVGASLDAIPKDHRFYAGGGGSVRGFGYQEAGPLDKFDNPIGGRSLAVISAELRTKITDTIGLVPFLDAGSDYASEVPDFKGRIALGAGIGLRYYTAIGPVRLDVATPLNPRGSIDSPIQIYVSLGQAF